MMPFSKSSRASIVGFAALTVILTAGAAQSLSGSNTVFSDDIVDGQVKFADIKPSAVTSSRIANGGVFTTDIKDGTITGTDVADFGLSNQDVGVLFAQVNGDGTLANSSGGVTSGNLGTGFYEVDFGRDVSACTPVLTAGAFNVGSSTPAITGVTDRFGNPEAFFVEIDNNAGTGINNPFHMVVVC